MEAAQFKKTHLNAVLQLLQFAVACGVTFSYDREKEHVHFRKVLGLRKRFPRRSTVKDMLAHRPWQKNVAHQERARS